MEMNGIYMFHIYLPAVERNIENERDRECLFYYVGTTGRTNLY
jgi:hypothetical protein